MFCANLCSTLETEELSKDWGAVLSAFSHAKPKDDAAHKLLFDMMRYLGPPFEQDVDCERQCAMGPPDDGEYPSLYAAPGGKRVLCDP